MPLTDEIKGKEAIKNPSSLRVKVYAGANGSFELYEDDGCTNEYKHGVFKKTTIQMNVDKQITLSFHSEGEYISPVERIALDVVYPKNAPFAVLLNGQPLPHYLYDKKYKKADCGWYYNLSTKSVEIKYPAPAGDYKVTILTDAMDLIGM